MITRAQRLQFDTINSAADDVIDRWFGLDALPLCDGKFGFRGRHGLLDDDVGLTPWVMCHGMATSFDSIPRRLYFSNVPVWLLRFHINSEVTQHVCLLPISLSYSNQSM